EGASTVKWLARASWNGRWCGAPMSCGNTSAGGPAPARPSRSARPAIGMVSTVQMASVLTVAMAPPVAARSGRRSFLTDYPFAARSGKHVAGRLAGRPARSPRAIDHEPVGAGLRGPHLARAAEDLPHVGAAAVAPKGL